MGQNFSSTRAIFRITRESLIYRIGLMQQLKAMVAILREHVTVATRQDNRQVRIHAPYGFAELKPAHARHDDVGEDDVESTAVLGQPLQRLVAVGGKDRPISHLPQCLAGELADIGVVFDDEHAQAIARP